LKALIKKYIRASVTDEETEKYLPYAKQKLEYIIASEGDSDGNRSKPKYLAHILAEIIENERFSEYCFNSAAEKMKGGQDYVQYMQTNPV